jgi:hypothetical protein
MKHGLGFRVDKDAEPPMPGFAVAYSYMKHGLKV